MNNVIKIIFVLFLIFFSSGCFGLRSAEGLSEGELNINYVAPLTLSTRYGITNNVEGRISIMWAYAAYDIFLHTNNKNNASNYGFYLGGVIALEGYRNRVPGYYAGFVYSKKINEYFIPYTSLNMIYNNKIERVDYSESYYALGSDIKIPISKSLTFLLTPEVGYVLSGKGIYDGYGPGISPVRSAINIGLIFHLY